VRAVDLALLQRDGGRFELRPVGVNARERKVLVVLVSDVRPVDRIRVRRRAT
jgi:hypothetical protein